MENDDHRQAKDALDRIWHIVEFHGGVPEEMIEEIDQVLSVYRYGTTVASRVPTPEMKRIVEEMKRGRK